MPVEMWRGKGEGGKGGKIQGFSRVMTRPAGRVKGVSKSRGSGRVMTREIRVTSRVKP